ncbi:S41 family peptidase [Larkinella soli]|uniref:S41 family peptidase n=1 Tax=Larkinella soli TaxID=1770527 RepID=UPI000FFC0DDF|nr:S41 family peptidase [Larkinella soli]
MKAIYCLLFLFLLASCRELPDPQAAPRNPVGVFDELWQEFRELYGPFEDRGIDWSALRTRYRSQLTDQSTETDVFRVCTALLSELNDGHVNLVAPGREGFNANRTFRQKIDNDLFSLPLVISRYLEPGFTIGPDSAYVYGTVAGGLAYLYLKDIGPETAILDKVLDQYADAKGLIIDLRHNGGGDFTYAYENLVRLTDRRRLVFSSATRNGPDPNDFTRWYDWYLEAGGTFYDKKLLVLVDRYCVSAGERTAMALKVLPQATLIGDSTNGALSTQLGRELSNGWYFTVATQKTRFADGRSYEGIGVIPSVLIKNNRANMAKGIDDTLEKARSLVR